MTKKDRNKKRLIAKILVETHELVAALDKRLCHNVAWPKFSQMKGTGVR
jgi:hypothetical protein